jgi:hypothetical protein
MLREMTAQLATRAKIEQKAAQISVDEERRRRLLDQRGAWVVEGYGKFDIV